MVIMDIVRLFKLKPGVAPTNPDPFGDDPFNSVFGLQVTDEFVKEIQENIPKLKDLSLEYFYKTLRLIINYNENFATRKNDRIKVDLTQVSSLLVTNSKNKETLLNYLDIIKEIGFKECFYKEEGQLSELENKIEKMVGKDTDNSRRASFSHQSKELSQVFDAEKEKAENADNDELNKDVKLYFEKILIAGDYNMAKNDKLSKFFLRNKENFNIMKIFLTMPLVYEVTPAFKAFCTDKQLVSIDDVPHDMSTISKDDPLGNMKMASHMLIGMKTPEQDKKNEIIYYRAYLVNIFLMSEGNHEALLALRPDYIENLMEAFYEGFKAGQSSLTLTLYLFEHLLQKASAMTCGLLFKYNFIFLFVEHIYNPKCFDFLLNLITPGSRIFGFKEEISSNIWLYIKCSGFFQDIVDGLINPESVKNNIKFDKFFSNSDLKEAYDKIMKADRGGNPVTSTYKKIIANYFVNRANYDAFLCNTVYGIGNSIDFPDPALKEKLHLQKTTPKGAQNRVRFNSSHSVQEVEVTEFKVKNSRADQYRKTKLLSKSHSLKQSKGSFQSVFINYYYGILVSVVEAARRRVIKKKTAKVVTQYSSKSQIITRSSRNELKPIVHTSQAPTKLILLSADENSIDGYIGSIKVVDLYPCFTYNSSQKSSSSVEDNEKFLKSLDKKKFEDTEDLSYRYVSFIYELVKDIYADKKILDKQLNTNNIKGNTLWTCLLEFKNSSLFKDLLLCFLYKIDYIYSSPFPEKTSPILAAKTVLLILKFIVSHPLADKYDNRIRNIIKENFYMFQEKFYKMYKFFNDRSNLANHKPINYQFKLLKEPFGTMRKLFCQLFFSAFELKLVEIEYFDVIDIKILQICFAWTFDKRHNTFLPMLLIGCMNNLVKIRAEKFMLEITIKLGFFDLIANFLQTVYVNETYITSYNIGNTMFFIKEFTKVYINMIKEPFDFPIIYGALSKFETFKYVCETLHKITNDQIFEVNLAVEVTNGSYRSVGNIKDVKETVKASVHTKKDSRTQRYFDEVNI